MHLSLRDGGHLVAREKGGQEGDREGGREEEMCVELRIIFQSINLSRNSHSWHSS